MNLNHFYHYYKSKSGGVSNLLKASEDFTSSLDWLKKPDTDAPTITGGVTDPNGGTDAQRVNFTANRQSRVQQSVTLSASTQYTFSVYARVNTGTDQFRLRNVTLGEAEAKTATTSWTRFEYTFTTTTGGVYELSIQNTENVAANIEFFGAMLNVGSSANAYVKVDPSTGGSAPTPAYSGFGDVFGGATAYYSLRKFTEAETLNAIRVRRSSDDTEQDIGFDANGDLDTTALTTFVNADYNTFLSDFANTDPITEIGGTGAINQSIGGRTGLYKFTYTGGATAHQGFLAAKHPDANNTYSVSFSIYFDTGQACNGFSYLKPDGTSDTNHNLTQGVWHSFSYTDIDGGGNLSRFIPSVNGASSTSDDGANFYLDTWTITQTTADGAVTTCYDQTGNGNDATNSTASEQPLVVSGGTLLEENGKAIIQRVDNSSTLKTSYAPNDGAATKTMIFVGNVSPTRGALIGSSTGSSDYILFSQDGSGVNILNNNATLSNEYLNGNSWVYADRNDVYDDLTSQGLVFANVQFSFSVNDMCLGYQADVTSNTNMMNYQELIIFDSDQSANRTGIEGNINDHFDIYT